MSMGSEDTFIFSVLLQTKILHPLLYGLGVYVTKPGKYAMVKAFKKFTFYDRTYIFTLFIMVFVLFTENQKTYRKNRSMYFRA